VTQRQKAFYHRDSSHEEIPWVRAADLAKRELKRPVVLIGGAFDLLHRSHMRLIFAAREKAEGGTLICALDSDRKVRAEKGAARPVLDWVERATTLNYQPIDFIVEIDGKEDFEAVMAAARPDLRVLGMEYRGKARGVRTMLVRAGNIHTSELVRRIKGAH
jgi:D-beta-D-heptose 7-phosphate kinase/D-beta-D-heptose 1-phosphate adenosyltransferase